jgi:hypothetical protein
MQSLENVVAEARKAAAVGAELGVNWWKKNEGTGSQ